ncbi:MAG: flagellar hook-length control protein FliK [Clostridia bacterium]
MKKNDFSSSADKKNDTKYRGLSASKENLQSKNELREATLKQRDIKVRKAVDKNFSQNNSTKNKEISKEELEVLAQASGINVQFLEQLMNGEAVEELDIELHNAFEAKALVEAIQDKLGSAEKLIGQLSNETSNPETHTTVLMDKLTDFLEKLNNMMQFNQTETDIIPDDMMEVINEKAFQLQGELEGLKSMHQTAEAVINQASDSLNTLKVQQIQNASQNNVNEQNEEMEAAAVEQPPNAQESKENSGRNSESKHEGFQFDGEVKVVNLQSKQQSNQAEIIPFSEVVTAKEHNITLETVKKQFSMQGASRENVLKQVVESAKVTLADDRSEMIMQLKPDNLGKLSLKIVTERGIMVAQFTAESQQVKEIIEASLPQLKDALESQGLNVKGFNVSVGDQNRQNQTYERESKGRVRRVTSEEQEGIIAAVDYNRHSIVTNPYQWSESSVEFTA